MAIYHRKLLSEPDSNQPIDCSACGLTCPYDCDYVTIYWPPQPPPSSTTTDDSSTTHISPYVIVIVAVIASAILFISYYLIVKRYCVRFRQPYPTQVNQESRDFMNGDHQPEIDHPIWYINTIGLQPAVIRSIAVVKFKKGESLIDVTDCSVCLSEFEDDESLRLLPKCNHAFHIPCIDTWLRSHTNCPLCRAAVLANNSSNNSQSNDQNGNLIHGFGLNRNTQMENGENDGELGSIGVEEIGIRENMRETGNNRVEVDDGNKEIQDSKIEIETMSTLRRAFSMDSTAEIVHMELNSSNSSNEMQSSNHIRDSRTRNMMTMRSFSYGGRSIM
ncbi:hypothetical protein Lser_V15G44517 [Lactuca serriola]